MYTDKSAAHKGKNFSCSLEKSAWVGFSLTFFVHIINECLRQVGRTVIRDMLAYMNNQQKNNVSE